MSSFVVDPTRMFEIANSGVSELLCAPVNFAVGNNNVVVAGVSGKRIRVIGCTAVSQGAVGSFNLIDGFAGAEIHTAISFPALATGTNTMLPITMSGYCRTTAGTGLYMNVFTAAVSASIYYIIYTP